MSTPRLGLLFAMILAAAMLPATGPSAAVAESCTLPSDFHEVAGQGPSCRVGSMWLVLLEDGSKVLTHGPDPLPAGGPPEPEVAELGGNRAAYCVPGDEPRQEAIYVRAADKADGYASKLAAIRSSINGANGGLYAEGQLFGAHREYRFLCDGDGKVHVGNVQTSGQSLLVSFGTIVSAVKGQGYNDPNVKYWIYYDPTGKELQVAAFAGQANLESDDRHIENNLNNRGGQYAVNYGYTGSYGAFVFMHEGGHTLGAVQNSAPHTTGAGHCTDGQDVMCYSDGGPHPYNGGICSLQYYDCNHDDYFHPDPPAGNYLATHWNHGDYFAHFIHHPDATIPPPPPPPVPPEPGECDWNVDGGETYWTSAGGLPHFSRDLVVPTGCPGHPFNLTSSSPMTADYDVCMLNDGVELDCYANVGAETGVMSVWTTTARVYLRQGTMGEFHISAFGHAA